MINPNHKQESLTRLGSLWNIRQRRMEELAAIDHDVALTMTIALRHKASWAEIGRAMQVHRGAAHKFYQRRMKRFYNVSSAGMLTSSNVTRPD